MKALALLLLICCALPSCVSHPIVVDRPDGSTIAYVGGSLAAKVGPRIVDITTRNGTHIKYASRSEDGTDVPKYLANMYTAAKLAEVTANSADLKTKTNADVSKHASDNALAGKRVDAQSKATSEGIAKSPAEEVVVKPITPPGSP